MLVDSIQMTKDIVKLLSRPDKPIILFLEAMWYYPILRRTSLGGVVKYMRGGEKLAVFRLKSPFFSETVQDRPMVAMLIGSQLISVGSNDLE